MFSVYKPTTVRRKHLEEISQTHFASLMYKLITCAKDCDDFSISFDGKRIRRRGEVTRNQTTKREYLVKNLLEDAFGFVEHQQKLAMVLEKININMEYLQGYFE